MDGTHSQVFCQSINMLVNKFACLNCEGKGEGLSPQRPQRPLLLLWVSMNLTWMSNSHRHVAIIWHFVTSSPSWSWSGSGLCVTDPACKLSVWHPCSRTLTSLFKASSMCCPQLTSKAICHLFLWKSTICSLQLPTMSIMVIQCG